MADLDLCYLSARDAIGRFRSRDLSPVELMTQVIARTEEVGPKVNAFADTYFEEALEQAKAAERRYRDGTARPLEGIPVGVKDAQRVAGKRTTHGSLTLQNNFDTQSDPIIERLQAAGAIIHARTTTPEFCLSSNCVTRLWGATRNPFNTYYGSGGSSGGSGASLAAGTSLLATGTDIGGSIRIPASCCGVVGYKPPKGRNPDGPPACFDPYNHCGPLTRSVADAALVQNLVSGQHDRDHHSLRDRVVLPDVFPDIRGLRIAWSMDFDYRPVDPEVRANTMHALDVFRSLGCTVDEVALNWSPECDKAAFHWYAAMHFGRQPLWQLAESRHLLTDYAIAMAEMAASLKPDEVTRSWEVQHEMHLTFSAIMQKHDLFICPTTAVPALPAEQDMLATDFQIDGRHADPEVDSVLTNHFNSLHNCPVMSVPSGRAGNGVPTGVQLVGRTFDDLTVFSAAAAFEAAVGGWFGSAQRPNL